MSGSAVGVIFVDFRRSFDFMNRDVLKYKMIGNMYEWIMNYLTGLKQYVEINGQQLELSIIETGVPQGSLLRLHMFAVDVSMICQIHRQPVSHIHLFADDTMIYFWK